MVLNGLWMYLWPKNGWNAIDPARVAVDLRELGVAGVIPHDRFRVPSWLYDTRVAKPADRIKLFTAEGLQVACGIGRAGGLDDEPAPKCVDAIVTALRIPHRIPAVLDWEGAYDRTGGIEKAKVIADGVLRDEPDAGSRICDAPWWAPLTQPGGGATHPRAPYEEFGRLAQDDRYVQAYGRSDGASLDMLRWSRSNSQYPAIARRARREPWTIRGAFLAYRRSWLDTATTLLAEPHSLLWNYIEMDPQTRTGLRVVVALRAAGYTGPDALTSFCAAQNIGTDQVPATLSV